MTDENKLPKAEEVLNNSGVYPEDFISSSCYEACRKAMHEYTRQVLDVVAKHAHLSVGDNEWDDYEVDKQSILKFKELLT